MTSSCLPRLVREDNYVAIFNGYEIFHEAYFPTKFWKFLQQMTQTDRQTDRQEMMLAI